MRDIIGSLFDLDDPEVFKRFEGYEGTATQLYDKLTYVAISHSAEVIRDKAWPTSSRWLWRRIKDFDVSCGALRVLHRVESVSRIQIRDDHMKRYGMMGNDDLAQVRDPYRITMKYNYKRDANKC